MLLNTTHSRLELFRFVLYGHAALVAAFLLLPIVFIALLSFGSSRWLMFPPPELDAALVRGAVDRSALAGGDAGSACASRSPSRSCRSCSACAASFALVRGRVPWARGAQGLLRRRR